jgi:hypothetical protein
VGDKDLITGFDTILNWTMGRSENTRNATHGFYSNNLNIVFSFFELSCSSKYCRRSILITKSIYH